MSNQLRWLVLGAVVGVSLPFVENVSTSPGGQAGASAPESGAVVSCDMAQYKATAGLTAAMQAGVLTVQWAGWDGAELRTRYSVAAGIPVMRNLRSVSLVALGQRSARTSNRSIASSVASGDSPANRANHCRAWDSSRQSVLRKKNGTPTVMRRSISRHRLRRVPAALGEAAVVVVTTRTVRRVRVAAVGAVARLRDRRFRTRRQSRKTFAVRVRHSRPPPAA